MNKNCKKVIKLPEPGSALKDANTINKMNFLECISTYLTSNSKNTTLLQHPTNTPPIAIAAFVFILLGDWHSFS